jgi:hypothetical protein
MDREQKFWICMWGMVVTFLITVTVCLTLSGFDRRNKWDKAVSNGADPMVANCALYSAETSGDIAICIILAQNRK